MELIDLAQIRRYRGSDNAVKIIGDREEFSDILENLDVHSRNELTTNIMSCYSGAAYADFNWTKKYEKWGNAPERITNNGHFANQYAKLSQLNLDPGLIAHLPELMEYLSKNNSPSNNYQTVREDFKKNLGTKTMWRGMYLNERELKETETKGIESDFFRKKSNIDTITADFEANILSTRFNELVERHFHGENPYSPLISVSAYEDVAIAVGRCFGKRSSPTEKREFYLFKINVPELDLIYYTEDGVKAPYKLKEVIENNIPIEISVEEKRQLYSWDRNVESFILYKIGHEEITEVSKPNITKSSWNNRITLN